MKLNEQEERALRGASWALAAFITALSIVAVVIMLLSASGCCSACHGQVCPDGRCIRE